MHWKVRGLSCKPNIYVSWSTSELRVTLAPWNRFKPSSKNFTDRSKAILLLWIFYGFFFCLVFAMPLCESVYMCLVVTCWERADLLALVCGVFCEFVTFPLVSWVRCGTWLYRFLIFATLLLCGHLLGNGWPLGSRLWCLTVSLSLSHWYPGSGVVIDCIDSWSLHPYLLLWCLFLVISRLILLMLLTLHPDIWTIFKILIMFILKIW